MNDKYQITQHIDFFAVGRMPWIVRVYLFLFLVLVIIVAVSGSKLPSHESLFNISSDMLKIVIGALLGVLSSAANQTWGVIKVHQDE